MLKSARQLDLHDLLSPGSQLVSEHLRLTLSNFMANLVQPLSQATNDGSTQSTDNCYQSVRHLKALDRHAPPNWVRGQVTTGHAAWSEVQTTILMDYLYDSFNTDPGSGHTFKDITYNTILPVINEWHEKGPQKTLALCKSKYNGVS
jgi:hypothetical protein